ncbi:tRNA (guanine37-N1)-methyltransferase [Agromyces sp. CF514]|uniref:GNAT family N-acetyltransferase n=1 Tax=Agromyces sp. CF514 TaxID=1881031 RepID=UPI0008EED8E9|nr:GNAT family N-acetyltransferase [Agromyces sp. CF514]SFR69989.1 tRNA (guanine37-N1)-methyltransferase [Agromyces sp. CF514]
MTRTTIRQARPTDAAALAELAADTFPLACPPSTTAEAIAEFIATNFTVERFDEHLADAGRMLVVAEDGEGTLVGYTMLIAGDPTDTDVSAVVTERPTIELSKCYTRKAAHGSGSVAGPLMEATVEAALATGVASIWLGVNDENARAIRFYEKHGFVKTGRKHFKLGDRYEDDWVLMRSAGAGGGGGGS